MNSSTRTAAVVTVTIVIISLLVWAGVHNARERRLAMQQASASHAMLVPDAAGNADNGDSMIPRLQGKMAPAFSLVDLSGKKVSLANFKDKPVLINFWATWCGPCKLEMPWFEEFNKKYAGQGLVILGIAADDAAKPAIASVASHAGVTYDILLKDDKVEDAYGGVNYLPESFYVDRNGKIMLETAGLNDNAGGKDEIEANIKKLIAAGQ